MNSMIFVFIFYLFFNFPQIEDSCSQPHPQMLHKKFPLLARVVLVVSRDKQAVMRGLAAHGLCIDASRYVRRCETSRHRLGRLSIQHVYGILVVEVGSWFCFVRVFSLHTCQSCTRVGLAGGI